jgi:ABC-2 type transport system ATP-binding protein
MIAVRDLKKSYAAIPALEGITFEVPTGTVTGFLGPNGAGKTTTLRILSGYMPATEGMAEVAGFDVRSESREVRKRTGYLPEDVPLYRDLTVSGFLSYMAGLKDVPAGAVKTEVNRVVEKTGLESVRDRLIFKCSRGYRQRTGLAMALLGDPPVLLLDEPTSGLDPNQVVEVRELIRDLSGEKTVLLSSHILSEVAQICGHVLIIHRGHLGAAGAPSAPGDRARGAPGRENGRSWRVDPGGGGHRSRRSRDRPPGDGGGRGSPGAPPRGVGPGKRIPGGHAR